ncbi:MAG: SAP domain-containing protein [Saccharofermentans sp.]|nr:SAP domain-containing protein [Saccharofermentans sp.]
MSNRPELSNDMDGKTFGQWYWLKEELVSFCRENGLPASGSKEELSTRISRYLDSGEIVVPVRRNCSKISPSSITLDSLIEDNFVCSEKHRAFFKSQLGDSFSFNVAFQKWLKSNSGKTYADAVSAHREIKSSSKGKRKSIDKQFEYNTYIRDFFGDNKGRSLEDAIRCWKYKKSRPGSNRYEREDLIILKEYTE